MKWIFAQNRGNLPLISPIFPYFMSSISQNQYFFNFAKCIHTKISLSSSTYHQLKLLRLQLYLVLLLEYSLINTTRNKKLSTYRQLNYYAQLGT